MASKQVKNGHWYVRYRDLNSIQRTSSVESEKNADRLILQIDEWLAEGIDPNRAMATFKETAEAFFGEHVIPNCKRKTMRDYQSAFERYHLRRWANTPLRRITKHDVKNARKAIESTGISAKRVNNVMVPVNKMFSWAEEQGYIYENPAKGLKPLQTKQEEMRYFTPEKLNQLVEACDMHDGFYRPHLLFLGWTGLRLGELRELRFKDIEWDLGRPRIHVQRTAQDDAELAGLPKSGKKRWVGVPPHIAEVLRRQEELFKTTDDDLVFPDHNGRRLDSSNLRQRVFHRTLEKLGWREARPKPKRFPKGKGARVGRGYCSPTEPRSSETPRPQEYRLHDLRHTYAYIFLNRGQGDIYALKETMGHAQISTTMKYAHFSRDDAVRAAEALEDAWNKTEKIEHDNHNESVEGTKSTKSVG